MNGKGLYLVLNFIVFAECDIEYVDPSAFVPPDDGLPPAKNGLDEDPYEKLVRGNLQLIDKQKVKPPVLLILSSRSTFPRLFCVSHALQLEFRSVWIW